MNIALSGYGKMGKIIEKIAFDRKHQIVLIIDHDNQHDMTAENLQKADVVIEFSTPDSVLDNIQKCIDAGVPIVVGTTGWYDQIANLQEQVADTHGALLYASNFSVGVNIFFHVK